RGIYIYQYHLIFYCTFIETVCRLELARGDERPASPGPPEAWCCAGSGHNAPRQVRKNCSRRRMTIGPVAFMKKWGSMGSCVRNKTISGGVYENTRKHAWEI